MPNRRPLIGRSIAVALVKGGLAKNLGRDGRREKGSDRVVSIVPNELSRREAQIFQDHRGLHQSGLSAARFISVGSCCCAALKPKNSKAPTSGRLHQRYGVDTFCALSINP